MRRVVKGKLILVIFLFIFTFHISSQESSSQEPAVTNPDRIHTAGIIFNQSFKSLESRYGDNTETLRYSITSAGISYGSFTGGRLGFVSDLNVCLPLIINFESQKTTGVEGISTGYLGGIGWNLWNGKTGVQPYLGFHMNYLLLTKDPIDQNMSNHILSFGLGGGTKAFYSISKNRHLYISAVFYIDTIEFSSASYDSREIKMVNNISCLISAGYGWTL